MFNFRNNTKEENRKTHLFNPVGDLQENEQDEAIQRKEDIMLVSTVVTLLYFCNKKYYLLKKKHNF